MKQLNTYFEGLLDKGTKSKASSALLDGIMDYMQDNELIKKRNDYKCTIDGNAVDIYVSNGVINIILDILEKFTNTDLYRESNLREIHFNTKTVISYSDDITFNQDITISGDDLIVIYKALRKSITNLNIKAHGVKLSGKTNLKDCNLDAHIIIVSGNAKTTRGNLKSDYIFIEGYQDQSNLKRLIKLGFIEEDYHNRIAYKKLNDDNKPLIDIDPIKELKLKNWTGDTIIIGDMWEFDSSNGYALITKNKSNLNKAINILEMKNGWWVGIFNNSQVDYIKSITNFKSI
jgi:hypothetical protein